jgi:hypothetical protein
MVFFFIISVSDSSPRLILLIIEQHIFIEFEFTPNYPAEAPIFKLDLPENEKLSVKGRQAIIDNLNEQVIAIILVVINANFSSRNAEQKPSRSDLFLACF